MQCTLQFDASTCVQPTETRSQTYGLPCLTGGISTTAVALWSWRGGKPELLSRNCLKEALTCCNLSEW